MKLHVDTALVEAARALGPIIREHADEAERERRLSRPVVDALAEAGLLRMYVPKSLGGLEVDPLTCARVCEEISRFDSAAGWLLMVAGVTDWFCSRLPDGGVDLLYADGPDAIVASAIHPPMQATEVDGGYRISGRSPLASGSHEARWFFFSALLMDGEQLKLIDGAPRAIGVILRADECEVLDTWHVLGMRGSDSNDVVARDVFVPSALTFPIIPDLRLGRHYRGPLYRMPPTGADVAVWTPIALALARAAIDEVRALAERKTPFASATPLHERASTQAKVGLAEATLRSARALLYDTLAEAWERTLAGEPSTLEQTAELHMAAIHGMQSAARVVELMYGVAGTSAIYQRNPLERHFRDMAVLKQHGFQSESRYETIGRVYLGLQPDPGVMAFYWQLVE